MTHKGDVGSEVRKKCRRKEVEELLMCAVIAAN